MSSFLVFHLTKCRRECPPRQTDTSATKRNIIIQRKTFSFFAAISPSAKYSIREGCDHMPDTTDAVECYGTAVYRLAYAMTRSRQ